MTTDIIRYGFVAGEVAESYHGRADLEKYDLALAEAENWFVDYHGGISNVQGTAFVDWIDRADEGFRIFPFKFSDTIANKYLILFGPGYIRFVQDGSYVLETPKAVEAINMVGSGAVVTITAHGFANNNLVTIVTPGQTKEMAGQTYKITVQSANTFLLTNLFGGNVPYNTYTAFGTGMTLARVYTVSHSYATADFESLKTQQVRDVVRITHPSYKTQNLTRISHSNWTLAEENLAKPTTRPGKPTVAPIDVNSYSIGYVITAVDADGNEGLPSDMGVTDTAKSIDTVQDSGVTVSWSVVPGTDYYNIYRTRVTYQGQVSRIFQVGYIGRSRGNRFVDTGIDPDFTKTPPRNTNPFARGGIKFINVTNIGSGYSDQATMTVSDPTGSGFIGYPVIAYGSVVGFIILDGGQNYTNPTITISGTGKNFACTVDLTPAADTDPAVSVVYQQRQIYAGSRTNPLTVYGSRPGKLSDFSTSEVLVASDAFTHEIDSENFSPIRHLVATRGGILVMSSGGIWLMSGTQSGAITATDVQADLNVATGAADVTPLKVGTDILYISNTGGRVNSLAYFDQYKLYNPVDVSILSNHLVSKYHIIRWTYADEPHRMVYAVREDGTLLLFTMIKDQEIYAWTRRVTKGYYKDVISFDGDGDSDVYFVVRRQINNTWVTVLEKLVTEKPASVEDSVYLDCSLSLTPTYPAATMQLSALTGTGITVSLDTAYFTNDHIGSIIRFGKGKARITSIIDSFTAVVNVVNDFDQIMNYSDLPRAAVSGEWTLDAEVRTVSSLHHLEGETVTALADGDVIRNLTVTNGKVTLPQSASRLTIGIPYKSIARNLPSTVNGAVIENKRKRVTSLALRVLDTRGLKVGSRLDELYEMRTEMAKVLGVASPLHTGITHVSIEPVWSEEAQNYFVQEYPLPATILGYIAETDVGNG